MIDHPRRRESTATQEYEKRRTRRIRLYSPVQAEVAGNRAVLVDLSTDGARLELTLPFAVGGEFPVRFTFEDVEVTVLSQVVRCRLDRSVHRDAIVYDTGLRFVHDESLEVEQLRHIIRAVVNSDLDARRSYTRDDR